jgi:hypothetical protein
MQGVCKPTKILSRSEPSVVFTNVPSAKARKVSKESFVPCEHVELRSCGAGTERRGTGVSFRWPMQWFGPLDAAS